MKKVGILSLFAISLMACSGPTDNQKKAAADFCDCMENSEFGDFDIDYYECDNAIKANYDGKVFADENYLKAMEAECPDIAKKLK
jgi:hypothetical protein